jgi:argininosuccinate lyase
MSTVNTGRLQQGLWPAAYRAAYGASASADRIVPKDKPLLRRHWQIHQAHLLMLIRQGLAAQLVRRVLAVLQAAESLDFAPLMGHPAPRGIYLATEDWLFAEVGAAAGVLHTGRSRNDLNATEQRLALRLAWRHITGHVLRTAAVFAREARTQATVGMPLHTHYQPAVLSTYGHWLAAAAHGLLRWHARLLSERPHLDLCPLGAAAIGGTSHPIDPRLTASLLGFARPFRNSIDAIAAKDHLIALLGLAAGLAHHVSRLVQDYRFRTTAELGWFLLPEGLAGGSSALPQKKNAWLLELATARSARAFGALTSYYMASFGEPHTNTIPAGSEGLAGAVEAIQGLGAALSLLRLHVPHLRPNHRALERAHLIGWPWAQVEAEELARGGMTCREAHHQIGAQVREQSEEPAGEREVRPELLDPQLLRFGGGAGELTGAAAAEALELEIASQGGARRTALAQWREARQELRRAVDEELRNPASCPTPFRDQPPTKK